jgi:hypothetical protein
LTAKKKVKKDKKTLDKAIGGIYCGGVKWFKVVESVLPGRHSAS